MAKRTTHTCDACGKTWTRPIARGTRPRWCPTCRPLGYTDTWCELCGNRTAKRQRFCSRQCATIAAKPSCDVAYTDCAGCGRTFTHDARQPRSRCTAGCRPAKATPARFHTGPCPRCGTTVTTDRLAGYNAANRYCSKHCAAKDAKSRRRARKRGAHTEPVYRRRIFERDGWRCQLCRRKVDPTKEVPHPRAPTIDHIVPLAAGGTHEPANVQTACFLCNCVKGDRGIDQLRLLG